MALSFLPPDIDWYQIVDRETWSIVKEWYDDTEAEHSLRDELESLIDWSNIETRPLSNTFIRKYKGRLNWELVCSHQKLSENFIREMQAYVSWQDVFSYQDVSEDFRIEFGHKLKKEDK